MFGNLDWRLMVTLRPPASIMPWARMAPNLAITSSCLSLITLTVGQDNFYINYFFMDTRQRIGVIGQQLFLIVIDNKLWGYDRYRNKSWKGHFAVKKKNFFCKKYGKFFWVRYVFYLQSFNTAPFVIHILPWFCSFFCQQMLDSNPGSKVAAVAAGRAIIITGSFMVLGNSNYKVWYRGSVPPAPDPTPFFSDFKDAKKKFSYFFLITYPQAHYLQS